MNTKVLVVDDEFLIRMSLESGLSDLGHQVKTAETFSEGLALAESWRPDVVLLDNKLGGELGLEHIEDFKKLDEDIQIIMITAYGSVSQAVEAMKRGACHYIQKPFDLEEVDLIIRRNLDQLKRRRSLELMRQRPRQIVGESEAIQRICRNVAILAEIFAAREQNTLGISSADLCRNIPGAVYCSTLDKAAAALRQAARPGDLILTVGAGDIYRAGEKLLAGV